MGDTQENNWPAVNVHWVKESRQNFKPGIEHMVFTESEVVLFTILPIQRGFRLFRNRRTEYLARCDLRNLGTYNRIGKTCSSLEEAKRYAESAATMIIRGPYFIRPDVQIDKQQPTQGE